MRLGDLDALKKAYFNAINETSIGEVSIIDLIDNAPTFDITKNQAYDQVFITAMKLYSRPQGQWIKQYGKSYELITDEGTLIGEFTKCPKCLYDKARGSNFCPNCGAKMR